MKLSFSELAKVFPVNKGEVSDDVYIHTVFTDSRIKVKKGLFIPLVGERFDGHDFLKDAINHGAIAAVWEEGHEVPSFVPSDFPIYYVKDTTIGLQETAKMYLQKVKPIVIGITGSNGKTTTKDIVESVLSQRYVTHKTKGNLNNHIGVPLTILSMPMHTEVLILEMGMNHFGEISALSKLATPDFGIITNIGESHIEFLGSREGIAKAKLEMLDGLKNSGMLFVDGDEPLLSHIPSDKKIVSCGLDEHCLEQLSFLYTTEKGIQFRVNGEGVDYFIPLVGHHNAKNALFAVALAKNLDVTTDQVKDGLATSQLTGMRLERFIGKQGALIINDAYNASPTSMKAAIETVKGFENYPKKIVVLGDMLELGGTEEQLHRSVADAISKPITDVVTIGNRASWIASELKERSTNVQLYSFTNKEDALTYLNTRLDGNTLILFKASRGAKFETIVEQLT